MTTPKCDWSSAIYDVIVTYSIATHQTFELEQLLYTFFQIALEMRKSAKLSTTYRVRSCLFVTCFTHIIVRQLHLNLDHDGTRKAECFLLTSLNIGNLSFFMEHIHPLFIIKRNHKQRYIMECNFSVDSINVHSFL